MPAQAIITPLSVHRRGGGATNLKFSSLARLSSVDLIDKFEAKS